MKYLFLAALLSLAGYLLTGCVEHGQGPEVTFGTTFKIVSGFYKGCTGIAYLTNTNSEINLDPIYCVNGDTTTTLTNTNIWFYRKELEIIK